MKAKEIVVAAILVVLVASVVYLHLNHKRDRDFLIGNDMKISQAVNKNYQLVKRLNEIKKGDSIPTSGPTPGPAL